MSETYCFACNEKIINSAASQENETYQFDNNLWIGFFGGYGMFVESLNDDSNIDVLKRSGASYEAVLCHDCAHSLCETHPWIDKLLNPLLSHSHTQEFWDAHPNHEGWDKD